MNRLTGEPEDISTRETARVLWRAVRYVAPFRGLFVAKGALLMLTLLPALLIPWPIKIIIDHVIEEVPVDQPVRPYPPLIQAAMNQLSNYAARPSRS